MTFNLTEQVLAILYILITLGYFLYAIFKRIRISLEALPDGPHEGARAALARFVKEVILQVKVIRDRPVSGLLHAIVFWGFISYIPATIHHFLMPFTGGYLSGPFASGYKLYLSVMSVAVARSIPPSA